MSRRERSQALLSKAVQTVEDRQGTYGDPYQDMLRTAKIWSAILKCDVSPEQVPLCMIGVKLARAAHEYKDDNTVDIVGYAQVYEETVLGMKGEAKQ